MVPEIRYDPFHDIICVTYYTKIAVDDFGIVHVLDYFGSRRFFIASIYTDGKRDSVKENEKIEKIMNIDIDRLIELMNQQKQQKQLKQ